jgi:hypothetical protein
VSEPAPTATTLPAGTILVRRAGRRHHDGGLFPGRRRRPTWRRPPAASDTGGQLVFLPGVISSRSPSISRQSGSRRTIQLTLSNAWARCEYRGGCHDPRRPAQGAVRLASYSRRVGGDGHPHGQAYVGCGPGRRGLRRQRWDGHARRFTLALGT